MLLKIESLCRSYTSRYEQKNAIQNLGTLFYALLFILLLPILGAGLNFFKRYSQM